MYSSQLATPPVPHSSWSTLARLIRLCRHLSNFQTGLSLHSAGVAGAMGLASVPGAASASSAVGVGLSSILQAGGRGVEAWDLNARLRALPETTYGLDERGRPVEQRSRSPRVLRKAGDGCPICVQRPFLICFCMTFISRCVVYVREGLRAALEPSAGTRACT